MGLIITILLISIGGPIIILYAIFHALKTHHENKVKKWNENGIEYKATLTHMGGHPDLKQNSNVEITAESNGNIAFREKSTGQISSIKAKQITHCEMSDESQLQSRITATRLMALGVFALAAKKNTTTHKYYLTLSYAQNDINNDINIDCLFMSLTPFGELISSINKLRLQANIKT